MNMTTGAKPDPGAGEIDKAAMGQVHLHESSKQAFAKVTWNNKTFRITVHYSGKVSKKTAAKDLEKSLVKMVALASVYQMGKQGATKKLQLTSKDKLTRYVQKSPEAELTKKEYEKGVVAHLQEKVVKVVAKAGSAEDPRAKEIQKAIGVFKKEIQLPISKRPKSSEIPIGGLTPKQYLSLMSPAPVSNHGFLGMVADSVRYALSSVGTFFKRLYHAATHNLNWINDKTLVRHLKDGLKDESIPLAEGKTKLISKLFGEFSKRIPDTDKDFKEAKERFDLLKVAKGHPDQHTKTADETKPHHPVSKESLAKSEFEYVPPDNTLDLVALTTEQISKMSSDQKGALVDRFALRMDGGKSGLTNAQFKGILNSNKPSESVNLINKQELGLGHCARYAINNAFQTEALNTDDFLNLTAAVFAKKLGMSTEDAKTLVHNNGDFGVDAGILEYILQERFHQAIEYQKIEKLTGCEESKQKAIENFIGNADWIIIGNESAGVYDMPSLTGATYPLTAGHFVAMRKDARGEWWLIDSRAPSPVNMPLAAIPRACTIIVPR